MMLYQDEMSGTPEIKGRKLTAVNPITASCSGVGTGFVSD